MRAFCTDSRPSKTGPLSGSFTDDMARIGSSDHVKGSFPHLTHQPAQQHLLEQSPTIPAVLDSDSCPYCGKIIRYKSNLRKHIADMHSGVYYQFTCPVCSKVFRTKNSMLTHTYRQHPGYKHKSSSFSQSTLIQSPNYSMSNFDQSHLLDSNSSASQEQGHVGNEFINLAGSEGRGEPCSYYQ